MKFGRIFVALYIFVLPIISFAYTYEELLKSIKYVAQNEAVAPEVLYTLVKIESNFNPYAISFLTNKQNAQYFKKLETKNIKIKISKYTLNTSKWVVSIDPIDAFYAQEIAKDLINQGFNIDVGLGQLNSANFDISEIKYVFDPVYNLTKCAKILRVCFNAKYKDIMQTIECYNYGMRKRASNPYYKRFYEEYKKEFDK